jgi:antitoxin component of RelBE/YafQ-DinJ toxin-antitoxin module
VARALNKIVQVRFDQTDFERLKKLAESQGIYLSTMIRMTMVQKIFDFTPTKLRKRA